MTKWCLLISIFALTFGFADDAKTDKPKTEQTQPKKEVKEVKREIKKDTDEVKQEVKKAKSGDEDPFKSFETTSGYEATFIRSMVVILCILILIGLAVWMFRRLSHTRIRQMNFNKSIKVLEKRPISPKSILYLVDVGGRQILIAESQLEIREITTLDFPKDLDPPS
ncbi:MAG: hypothetical protein SP1CHLAM54_06080 [Chlamydiia bacterium]|nr:hypothetical protein [Chlamydiia bacterium]MCH9615518.1 hypothetical protein [Chlamydiia bacterium]MCH9629173.1 hypothetical protein [Chlamydiia bacterium]